MFSCHSIPLTLHKGVMPFLNKWKSVDGCYMNILWTLKKWKPPELYLCEFCYPNPGVSIPYLLLIGCVISVAIGIDAISHESVINLTCL